MPTDEELVRAWQRGDVEALETLVRRYHAPLVAHLYRVLGDTHLAEDLAQETFLRLVRDVQTYRYPRPFRPWFYAIAHHLVSNHYASAYARRVELRTELPEAIAQDRGAEFAVWSGVEHSGNSRHSLYSTRHRQKPHFHSPAPAACIP